MAKEQLSISTIFPLENKVEANFVGDAYLQTGQVLLAVLQ